MSDGAWPAYGTDENKAYRFRPIVGQTLRFQVKAAHDAHVCLTSAAEETASMLEVFIGGWEGAASAIRANKADDLCKVDTPDILSEEEFREFWVAFDHEQIRVGKGGEWEPFMSATMPEPFAVSHFGYSTGWGAVGWWLFHHERTFTTDDCLAYNFEPLYGDTVTVSVSCSNDAHIALASGPEETSPMYEVFIGGWENQSSAIRLNKGGDDKEDVAKVDTPDAVCEGEMRTFVINVKDGHIRVSSLGGEPFAEWQDPEPWKVTHVGYCTGWGATGKWKLEI